MLYKPISSAALEAYLIMQPLAMFFIASMQCTTSKRLLFYLSLVSRGRKAMNGWISRRHIEVKIDFLGHNCIANSILYFVK